MPRAIYLSVEEIERLIQERRVEADALPDGEERQAILKEIARLRIYADAKQWMRSPG